MKTQVQYLQQKNIIFKSLREITPKELESRKKILMYVGVDLKGYYAFVVFIRKSSRFIIKDVEDIMSLHLKAEKYIDSKIKKLYVSIDASLCSKARVALVDGGWRVWHDE